MKAKLVTYTTEELNNSQKSILGKKLYGYKDKSNKSQYTYHRKGVLTDIQHIKITNNTFVVLSKDWEEIEKVLKKRKANIQVWNIDLKRLYFKNTSGADTKSSTS